MKPVCMNCQTQMKIEKTGATILFTFMGDQPYQAYHVDTYKCHDCESTVAFPASSAERPFWNHFEDAPAPDADAIIGEG